MANKIGDVVMIYGSPTKKEWPIGEAKLLAKMSPRSDTLEYWQVEFISEPGRSFNQFIPAENGADKK
jgi:hypothetical protein